MPEFLYQDPFPQGKDDAKYRLLTKEYVSVSRFNGKEVLVIDPEGAAFLAPPAVCDRSHSLPARSTSYLPRVREHSSPSSPRGAAPPTRRTCSRRRRRS